eukprot:TRINITY_DN2461_c0_g2_i1.p1 TRINITY_DN2461_c0_g2~~TRINITY_DN2461_c0_g2_i1.p1  ORF type:complete len:183 (-),score=5.63 TRINITY_DN2461_c0_g2_i1:127-675(-)
MNDSLSLCILLWWFIIYYIYFFVQVGFGAHTLATDISVLGSACIVRNLTDFNCTSILNEYSFCSDFRLSHVGNIVLFTGNAICAGIWLGMVKFIYSIFIKTETKTLNSATEVDDLKRQLTEKDIHIMTLQGQLADRKLLIKATAKLDNNLPAQVEETNEKARLLPQKKSHELQAPVNSVYKT